MRLLRTTAALIIGAAIIVAAIGGSTTAASAARPSRANTATAALSSIGTLDAAHPLTTKLGLVVYGNYAFDPFGTPAVSFNQHLVPSSVPQLVSPYILVPDGNPHTYQLQFHVRTDSSTNTQYQLSDQHGYQSSATITGGDTTVPFTLTVQFSGATWEPLTFKNVSGDNWVFLSVKIDE